MGLKKIVLPETLYEALSILAGPDGPYRVCAGGTDIFAAANTGRGRPLEGTLVSLQRVGELRTISLSGNDLVIGANCTFSQIIRHDLTAVHAPLLAEAAGRIASPQIRNLATIAGNVVNASPAGDGLTALAALDAAVELAKLANGAPVTRQVPVSEFVCGPGRTLLEQGELVTAFRIPSCGGGRHWYEKVGMRASMAISVVNIAFQVRQTPERDFRAAIGSLGPRVVVCREAEQRALRGDIGGAVSLWMDAISPISDLRATAEYRRQAGKNILTRQAAALLREG